MTNVQKAEMYRNIEKHGDNLNAIFNTPFDSVTLCKKLRRLERKAEELTTHECNTGEDKTAELDKILKSVHKVLFATNQNPDLQKAIFINGDPRGYALKIKDSYVREKQLNIHRDAGGYGIIAPDFTPNN